MAGKVRETQMQHWSIYLKAARLNGPAVQVTVDMLSDLADELSATTSGGNASYDVTFTVQAGDPRRALVEAEERLAKAVKNTGLPLWPVVRAEVMTEGERQAENERPAFLELVGVTEVAELFGVTKQRVSGLAKKGRLPTPVAELAAGPVWSKAAVEAFLEQWPRRTGRPPKTATSV